MQEGLRTVGAYPRREPNGAEAKCFHVLEAGDVRRNILSRRIEAWVVNIEIRDIK